MLEVDIIKGVVGLGVTGFMFISGFYGVTLRLRKLFDLWAQTTFYAIASCIGLFLCFNYSIDIKELLGGLWLFDGTWWFVSYYFFLVLLSPIFNKGIENITQKQFAILLSFMAFTIYGVMWFHCKSSAVSLHLFIFMYLLGRYMAKYPIVFVEKHSFRLFILFFVLLCLYSITPLLLDKPQLYKYVWGNFKILLPLTFIPLFYACNKKNIRGKVTL